MLGFPLGILSAAGAEVAGAYELIATEILTANTPSVTFSSLATYASTYKHLQIRAVARCDRAETVDEVRIRLNADTGSNYSFHRLGGAGGSVVSEAFASQTSMLLARVSGATIDSNIYGPSVIDILDPFSTTKNTTLRGLTGVNRPTNPLVDLFSGAFYNTSAVTSINLFPFIGANFVAGSRFSLYGVRG